MKNLKCLISLLCLLSMPPLFSQKALESLNTDFDNPSDLAAWTWLHEKQGQASKLLKAEIEEGALHIEPNTSAWYADYQAPFFYQLVSGNFDISARILVSGKDSSGPKALWSLGGLMFRYPNGLTKTHWVPEKENWLFITTGVADPNSIPVFETKTTISSRSNLKLKPAKAGWVTLRAIRIDNTFILLYQYDDEEWQVLERFYRTDLPSTLQAGLIAYTDFYSAGALLRNIRKFNETVIDTGNPDMLMKVDYIKATKPDLSALKALQNNRLSQLQHWTPGNLLSDYSISNDEVLKLLGLK